MADDVRPSIHVTERVGEALRDAGLSGRRIGVVGASFMSAAAYLGLQGVAGDTSLVRADDLIERLRVLKSPAEQDLIRRAVAIGNRAVDAITEAAVEGATEADCAKAGVEVIAAAGAALYDIACASGASAHQFTWARLPSHDAARPLRRGGIFHFDCYGAYGGYLWDFGRTRVVGDAPTSEQRALLEATIEGVGETIAAIRPGVQAGDVYAVAARWMEESPVIRSLPEAEPEMESFPAVGHGLGMSWEPPWLMEGGESVLEPGMYLAVEMLLGHESVGGVMFEENGLVTDDGFEVLSTARARWW